MTTTEAPSSGLPPLGLVPGVHYRCWSPYDMLPNDWVSGRGIETGAYVWGGPGELRIDLDLEIDSHYHKTRKASIYSGVIQFPQWCLIVGVGG